MINIKDKVKDFTLRDSDLNNHSLSDYLGKKVVIYIYPKNNTPGCNAQACSFRDNIDLYNEKNIVVLGISSDNIKSHQNFKNKFNLNFITLSDENMDIIKYFGAYGKKTMFGKSFMGVKRMTFVIDELGYLIIKMPKVNAKDNAFDVLEEIRIYEENN